MRLRVLRVQSRICIGGPALNPILLSAHLPEDRFETVLVGGRLEEGEKTMEPFARKKGVNIQIIEEMGRAVRWTDDLKALWKLIRLIRQYKPHIVHTHTAKAGAIGRLAAFLCRVPIRVHTFHGHVFHGYFSPLVTRAFIWLERLLAFVSHRIVAISPRQMEDLTQVYKVVPKKKCHIVRLGFELENMTKGKPGAFKASLGLDRDVKLAGILARLVPIKNHQLLLNGIAAWKRRGGLAGGAPVRFLMIGDGELRETLEAQARELEIDDVVLFTGWRGDVEDIYADLDLNILVSRNEGTPVTLIEGLACGIPVLTTDVGGVRDFVEPEMGRIVPADVSPETLGRELEYLLNETSGRLKEEMRKKIMTAYGASRLVGDMAELYETLTAERLPRI